MITMSTTINPEQRESARRMLAGIRNGLPRAEVRAINKVARSQRSQVVKQLAAQTGMAQKDIRKANVRMRLANFKERSATLRLMSKAIKAIRMAARQTKKGASWIVNGVRQMTPHTFIATMPTGHVGVFKRRTIGKGSKRLPIDEQYGPNPLDKIDVEALKTSAEVNLSMEFDRQVDLILEQADRG